MSELTMGRRRNALYARIPRLAPCTQVLGNNTKRGSMKALVWIVSLFLACAGSATAQEKTSPKQVKPAPERVKSPPLLGKTPPVKFTSMWARAPSMKLDSGGEDRLKPATCEVG